MAAFSVSMIAESEHARSEIFDNPESVYRACADMKPFNQEMLRCLLLDTRQRLICVVDVTKGTSTKLWLIHEKFFGLQSPIQPNRPWLVTGEGKLSIEPGDPAIRPPSRS
jgi:hypothetical protein